MDFPEYQKVIQEVYRVTRPGGFFQFSITHPCFSFGVPEFIKDEEGHRKTIILSGYFKKRKNQIDEWIFGAAPKKITEGLEKFKIPKFNHTLSELLNAFIKSGFILEKVVELVPSKDLIEKDPSFLSESVVANFILFRFRKSAWG